MKYPFVISQRQNQIYLNTYVTRSWHVRAERSTRTYQGLDTYVLWYHRKDISCTTSIASDNNIEQLYPNRASDFYIAFLMELTDKMGKVQEL